MNCSIERPNPQDMFDKYKDMFSSIVLKGGNVIPESNEWYVVSLNYAMAEEFWAISDQQWKQRDARYACCENLYDLASKEGVFPYTATPASGYVRITGIPQTPIPQNLTIDFAGQKFIPAGSVPGSVPDDGFFILRIRAIVPGPEGNSAAQTTGTIESPPAGLDATVTPYGNNFCGGAVAETCEQFRSRYISMGQFKPSANLEWIKEKALEWPCVTDVCEPGINCCETDQNGVPVCPTDVKLYALFRDTFPCGLAPQCVLDELNDWMFGTPQGYGKGQAPFGICGQFTFVRGFTVDVFVDGLACATSAQQQEISSRIRDFVDNSCPSTNVTIRQLEVIIAQVIGNVESFTVVMRPDDCEVDCNEDCVSFSDCGDAVVKCDCKLCIGSVQFVNTQLSATGCL